MKTRRQRRKKKKKTKINSILIRIPTTKIAPPHWFGPQPLVLLLLRLLDYVVLVAMAMDTGGLVVVLMTVIVLQVVDNDVSLFMVLYSAVGQNGAFGGACRAPSIHPSIHLALQYQGWASATTHAHVIDCRCDDDGAMCPTHSTGSNVRRTGIMANVWPTRRGHYSVTGTSQTSGSVMPLMRQNRIGLVKT
jgi:hypothetical protein